MAELVDALVSGTSGGNPVEVQVLFSAPHVFCAKYFKQSIDRCVISKDKRRQLSVDPASICQPAPHAISQQTTQAGDIGDNRPQERRFQVAGIKPS